MRIEPRKFNKALTLIEVLVSLLVILIVVIGVMSYMYACAENARRADVRVSATRLGLLVMEGWKADSADITLFDPAQLACSEIAVDTSNTIMPVGGLSEFQASPKITVNGVSYFVKLTYDLEQPQKMEVLVAWNPNNYSQSTGAGLGDNPETIVLHGYAIY